MQGYASAVFAMALSACHKAEFYQNGRMDRTGFWHRGYPCVRSSDISKATSLWNFVTNSEHSQFFLFFFAKALCKCCHTEHPPWCAHVAQWSKHSGATCSRVWCTREPGFKPWPGSVRLPKTYFKIPRQMMNREIIPGRKRGFNGVLYKLWLLLTS